MLSAYSNISSVILLSWSEPEYPNGQIVSYTIVHNETDINQTSVVYNSTQFSITGLIPFTFYKITVYASTRIGPGPSTSTIIRSAESSKSVSISICYTDW